MKMRNKCKVHPVTSSSYSKANKDSLSVLKLLPAAIFTLLSVLSAQDREVLAYMITRSLQPTNSSFLPCEYYKKKRSTKQSLDSQAHNSPAALVNCDCFDCYTSIWFSWDSSPNRELIHQVIEAFEEHLNNGEQLKKKGGNSKNKRKEKMGRRKDEKTSAAGGVLPLEISAFAPQESQEDLLAAAEVDNGETGCRELEEEVEDDFRESSAVVHNHRFCQENAAGRDENIQFAFVESLESECIVKIVLCLNYERRGKKKREEVY